MSTKKGIDVSEHNGTLDWAKVKAAGIEFAMIRSGYGKQYTDPQFSANVAGAAAQKIPYGIYHYSYALSADDARREAALVVQLLQGTDPVCGVWLDMEDADGYKAKRMTLTKSAITEICSTFVQAVQAAGYRCGVYANKSWLETYIDVSQLNSCDIWLAQWASKPTWSGTCTVWQYSATGTLTGLSGNFDLDLYYGDLDTTMTATAAITKLAAAGIIQSPKYWLNNHDKLPYLDDLLVNMAKHL
jgi:GH25 family lysozyme M1 (1,4-beta-N-acetylmuramidase)